MREECPFQGNYTFEFEYTLPGGEGQNLYWGSSFGIEALLSAAIRTRRRRLYVPVGVQTTKSKYQIVWSVVGFSILGSVVASIGISRRNTRRRVRQKKFRLKGSSFRRMKDIGGKLILV
jgi:hypothetical protein